MTVGDRKKAISSAPDRSMFAASAASRADTFSGLAASRSSLAAWHCRRTPPSYQVARHRSPGHRAGYTVIPPTTSTTTRPFPRVPSRASPRTAVP